MARMMAGLSSAAGERALSPGRAAFPPEQTAPITIEATTTNFRILIRSSRN
jgi:hypothetical protein